MVKEEAASLSDQVHSRLQNMIHNGDIKPGERLVELKLTRVFRVSRSPVRHALLQLEAEGIIVSMGRRGYMVQGVADPDALQRHPSLEDISIDQSRQWERIYALVEQAVLAAVLYNSVRINEVRLAEHYDVSRTVTRDVLARMHGVGIIDKTRSGSWIAERITPEKIRNLYELRALLEPAALRLVAGDVPATQIAEARARISRLLLDSSVDGNSFDQVERDLHIDIIGTCSNREIVKALERTHILFAPTRHLFDPVLSIPLVQIEDALREHLRILELLEQGEREVAADQLASHLKGAVDRWLGRFGRSLEVEHPLLPNYLTVLNR
jgi:DNA-binding GntR family transcriptional regulator